MEFYCKYYAGGKAMKFAFKIILALCLTGLLVSVSFAASNGNQNPHPQSVPGAEALKGPAVTDLTIYMPSGVTDAKKIQIKAYYTNGTIKFTRNYGSTPSVNGIIALQFNDLDRQERLDIRIQTSQGWLETSTIVLLRPDLLVFLASAEKNVLVGDTLPVNVSIREIKGDTGAGAEVSLHIGETLFDTVKVNLTAGGTANATLSTAFMSRGLQNLSIKIKNSIPAEYDETNNVYESLAVRSVAPDIALSNINTPTLVGVWQTFGVLATITEQYGEVGSKANVVLLENETILDSKSIDVQAGGSAVISLTGILNAAGSHNLVVRITSSSPPDDYPGNNEQGFIVVAAKQMPSIIGYAPVSPVSDSAGATRVFNISTNQAVNVTWYINGTEVSSQTGVTESFYTNTSADTGTWNISAVAINNNGSAMQAWDWTVTDSQPLSYTGNYHYQTTFLNTSHYVTSSEYTDNSEELILKYDEILSFTAASNKSVSFPIDRIYINITNEAGEGSVYEVKNIDSTEGSGTFKKFYPDDNALLTIRVDEAGTTINLETKANQTITQSKGYMHWWFKPAQEWNVTTNSCHGKFIKALETLNVRVEIEDREIFMGGNAAINISNQSYTGGWVDNNEGWFEERREVWIFSGAEAGDTVT